MENIRQFRRGNEDLITKCSVTQWTRYLSSVSAV